MEYSVDIDQSFKFENTKDDTSLAFANGKLYSILIPASVKRACIKILREKGISGKKMYTKLFAISLYFLLKEHILKLGQITIDREYPGKEGQIKDHLINLLNRHGVTVQKEQIHFGLVGKQSGAHIAALATFRKKRKPNLIVTVEQLLGEF
jgi:hypothetical protein